jgi:hypothetical protein
LQIVLNQQFERKLTSFSYEDPRPTTHNAIVSGRFDRGQQTFCRLFCCPDTDELHIIDFSAILPRNLVHFEGESGQHWRFGQHFVCRSIRSRLSGRICQGQQKGSTKLFVHFQRSVLSLSSLSLKKSNHSDAFEMFA